MYVCSDFSHSALHCLTITCHLPLVLIIIVAALLVTEAPLRAQQCAQQLVHIHRHFCQSVGAVSLFSQMRLSSLGIWYTRPAKGQPSGKRFSLGIPVTQLEDTTTNNVLPAAVCLLNGVSVSVLKQVTHLSLRVDSHSPLQSLWTVTVTVTPTFTSCQPQLTQSVSICSVPLFHPCTESTYPQSHHLC